MEAKLTRLVLVLAIAALMPIDIAAAQNSASPAPAAAKASPTTPSNDEESRHEGYYYPKLTTSEVYKARTRVLPQMDRASRLLFMSSITRDQASAGYAPRFAAFAKGDQAEKMIIIGLDDGSFDTLFRARAVMAALSSLARTTPLLRDANLDDVLTFYDLAHLLGFKEINVSDGRKWAHRITLVE
jgi:hypothetical protein